MYMYIYVLIKKGLLPHLPLASDMLTVVVYLYTAAVSFFPLSDAHLLITEITHLLSLPANLQVSLLRKDKITLRVSC